ncbi:MAG: translation elongation factor 4 [Candidatus Shikimatogenerans bostrichidophilus]|nr:MAG: translation elongation factor 4 [Candidatus Shikimatogenerans bostrichidophilus]
MNIKLIRNFCIIAHIDHGKSTLAYQLLKYTKTIKYNLNLLDNMDLEKEKGITIKNHIIQINYNYNNKIYKLNLIDTPGHADFKLEVYKSIIASEGAILLVDISKNIQAQTLYNVKLAQSNNKPIIPVLNKIDLENIDYRNVINDVKNLVKCKEKDIILISAKKGIGIKKLIKKIINKIPSPNVNRKNKLKALILDSYYDSYKGIFIYFRIFSGIINNKDKLKLLSNNKIITVNNLKTIEYKNKSIQSLSAGNIGKFLYRSKNLEDIINGDTLVTYKDITTKKILKINRLKSNIFLSIFPINSNKYKYLENSIKKLKLNDSSFTFVKDFSNTFGYGFRCGFLGLLHFEIIKERILREYKIDLITTIPNVKYKFYLKNKKKIFINNPLNIPKTNEIIKIKEPYENVKIITLNKNLGNIITYCIKKRGILIDQKYKSSSYNISNYSQVILTFNMPLNEIIYDFNNKLKILTKGYNTIVTKFIGYKTSNIIKVDILINKVKIDGFSFFSHKNTAYKKSKKICLKLKNLIPKKQFKIIIQAYVNSKIIVKEIINSYRKDVSSKCYGGDITRKMKLLNKQKIGKKKMYKYGKIELPNSIFYSLINID